MKSYKQLFVFPPVMILALFTASLGYLIPQIQEAYGLSYSSVGFFSTLQSAGMMIAIVVCFCVFSGLNKSRLILIGSFALAGFIMLLSAELPLLALYSVFFFIGLSMNLPDTLSHALIADLSGRKSAMYISLLHALWAIVGVIGPFFAMLIDSTYKKVFLITGMVTALAALVFWFGLRREVKLPFMENRAKMGSIKKLIGILKNRGMFLFFLTSLLCCFVQMPLIYFVRIYAEGATGSGVSGATVLSCLYFGFFAGGLIFALISHKVDLYKLMIISNTLCLLMMVAMLTVSGGAAIAILVFLSAACMAPSLPIMFAKACDASCDDTAAASALIFFGVALSALVAPPLIGAIADLSNLRIALLANAGIYIGVIGLSVLLYKLFDKPLIKAE